MADYLFFINFAFAIHYKADSCYSCRYKFHQSSRKQIMSLNEFLITFFGWGSVLLAYYLYDRKRNKKNTEENSD